MIVADASKDGVLLIVHAERLATAMRELKLEVRRVERNGARH